MSTVDKATADAIIAANGRYQGDAQVYRIVLYTNAFNGARNSYGFENLRNKGKYAASDYIIAPEVYWEWDGKS
jgi:hypothetical protein